MPGWYQRVVLPRLLNSEMGSKEFEDIRRLVLKDATGVVLEIGSGPGYNFALYENVSKLYALEPSRELVEISKARTSKTTFPIEFLSTGAENISLLDGSVDTVVSTWTLCSVSDPSKVLGEIRRVLKPGGKFVFVDHGASPNIALHLLQTIFTWVSKYFTGNCHCDRKIPELIQQAGFRTEKMTHPSERFKPMIYNYQGVAVLAVDYNKTI